MASSLGRRGPNLTRSGSGSGSTSSSSGVLSQISEHPIVQKGKTLASDTAYVAKRLLKSTGKAAWIAATTFIVLGIPLIIEMDRESQLNEADMQQASLLGAPPSYSSPVGPPPN